MRLGVVGTGYWGSNHARVATQLRDAGLLDRVTLCDVARDRVAALADDYDTAFVTDHRELAVDAAIVATPSHTHRDVATDLLAAGTDVLVEKPLALSSEDAWAIVDAADDAGRVLATGHVFRYHPALNELERRLDDGELGAVDYLRTTRFSHREPRATAGTLHSLAVHDVDVYSYLLGEPPASVYCRLDRDPETGVDRTATLTLDYPTAVGTVDVSWQVPAFGKRRELTVVGSRATAHVDYLDDTVVELYETDDGTERTHRLPDAEPLRVEVEAFLDACRTGSDPPACGRVGARAVDLVAAAERSAERGRVVEVER